MVYEIGVRDAQGLGSSSTCHTPSFFGVTANDCSVHVVVTFLGVLLQPRRQG